MSTRRLPCSKSTGGQGSTFSARLATSSPWRCWPCWMCRTYFDFVKYSGRSDIGVELTAKVSRRSQRTSRLPDIWRIFCRQLEWRDWDGRHGLAHLDKEPDIGWSVKLHRHGIHSYCREQQYRKLWRRERNWNRGLVSSRIHLEVRLILAGPDHTRTFWSYELCDLAPSAKRCANQRLIRRDVSRRRLTSTGVLIHKYSTMALALHSRRAEGAYHPPHPAGQVGGLSGLFCTSWCLRSGIA